MAEGRLAEAKSGGFPLWDGKAILRARIPLPDESAVFAGAKNKGQPSDGLMLVYGEARPGPASSPNETCVGPEPDAPKGISPASPPFSWPLPVTESVERRALA
jgi:hypothetical protein